MRTLLISELFPPRVGGTARWFSEVYGRYPAGEAFVLTDVQDGNPDGIPRVGPSVSRVPMQMSDWGFLRPRSVRGYGRLLRHAYRMVRSHGVQTVHCGRVMPEGVIGYLLRRIARIPYCVYAHGEEIGTALSSRQLTLLMRCAYGAADRIIANSRNTQALLCRVGVPEARVTRIAPGVDIRHFTPGDPEDSRRRLGLQGQRVLLSVGRLQRRKGQDLVIQALPGLLADMPDLCYLIVGTGEEDSRLRSLADELGVGSHVRFAGAVPDRELPDFYRACDVFVLPNREEANQDIEGFGIVFLEANACGKPVVGGRSGGTSDAVVDGLTGLLVDGENLSAIAHALRSLLRDRGRAAALGAEGRRRVVESFSWEQVTEQIRRLE
ncbi:MAG TPA: glycosyltransferase family 4 protein [Candidatus Acidoferrum sp.]|nr:glycosyltransferase family 4 protein [Candidatus Acidoferrum sp.]